MDFDVSRRRFFGGRVLVSSNMLRPPGAVEEGLFLSVCTRCGDCRAACPGNIIIDGDGGYPVIDFMEGECTFCEACAKACDTGALAEAGCLDAWPAKAGVGEQCLAFQGVICQVCSEQCEQRAIQFQRLPGSIPRPLVNLAACTGCGACVAPCPVSAIQVTRLPQHHHSMETVVCTSPA